MYRETHDPKKVKLETSLHRRCAITVGTMAIYPRVSNRSVMNHRPRRADAGGPGSVMIQSPWHLSSVETDRPKHCTRNTVMMGRETVREYRNMERSGTWTAGNLKSEYAYANIRVQYVGLAYRRDCMHDAKSVPHWNLRIDRRRCEAMVLVDSIRKGKALPASASRIPDSIRARSDGEKRPKLSSVEQRWIRSRRSRL